MPPADEDEPDDPVVARGKRGRELAPQHADPAGVPQPAPHEFQTGIRGEPAALVSEGQLAVDAGSEFRFWSSHRKWPFGVGDSVVW